MAANSTSGVLGNIRSKQLLEEASLSHMHTKAPLNPATAQATAMLHHYSHRHHHHHHTLPYHLPSTAAADSKSLSYHEPPILTILTQTSFLLLLNLLSALLSATIYCGLLERILLGVIYGIPPPSTDHNRRPRLSRPHPPTVVYGGGLTTSLPVLLSNLPISIVAAATIEISALIVRSFLL